MPLYEYQCRKCAKKIEIIQLFSDPLKTKCPSCKGRLEKLLSAPAIRFKGTGWYVTDYGGKSGGKEPTGPPESSSGDKPADKSGEKSADKSGDKGGDKGGDKSAGKSAEKGKSSGDSRPGEGKGSRGRKEGK